MDNIAHVKFTVSEAAQNQRIGKYLSKNYKHIVKSRLNMHRSFKRNEITVNGKITEETKILQLGDIVEIKYDKSVEEATKMQHIPIRICYQDNHLAIVWKPSGQNFILFEKAIHAVLKDDNTHKVWCINDIQKAASGLILVAKTENVKELLLQKYNNNEIQITMRLLVHGAIDSTDSNKLFTTQSSGKEEEAEAMIPSQILKEIKIISQTPSNNAEFITRLDLELCTPLSSANLKKLFFFQSNHPIIGNSKHTRQLKVNDKGLCAALIGMSFTHPILDTLVKVIEEEPSKFSVLCDREAKFHQIKLDKEAEEIKQLGIMPIDAEERKEGQLIAYLTGQKQFYGHWFKVTKDCLIPRASSETLVRASIAVLKTQDQPKIMDVGTGCGNLIISILHQIPTAKGIGIDISEAALNVAKENGSKLIHDHADRLEWRIQDMSTLTDTDTFDLLVCNPPYLDFNKVSKRRDHKSITEQEPSVALFAENEGYQWYHVLSKVALTAVKKNGHVILECGKGMMDNVLDIWCDWEQDRIFKDSQGWDRCLVLKRKL